MVVILSRHRCKALKAAEAVTLPEWEEDIKVLVSTFKLVCAPHALQCRKIEFCVEVKGDDPHPQQQYRFP